jgi:pyruvate/2-oxoglutarate dehydrogenase complex dihydrolipoamide acyltransferase (E2) component
VTLPDWLFDGEQQAPEVAEAAAVATAEEMEAPAPAPEAAAEEEAHEEEEERRQVQAHAAGSEMHIDADAPALVQPGGNEIGAEQSAAKKKVGHERAVARDPASDVEEAANEEGEEDEDFCHLCGQSGEWAVRLLCMRSRSALRPFHAQAPLPVLTPATYL